MSKIREYSAAALEAIASGELLPKRNKRWAAVFAPGPTKLLPDHSWVHKTIEELEKEGRIDSEVDWTRDIIKFIDDLKVACHFKTELSDETKNKLMNAINDMLERRSQDLFKPPCSIEVTEGDDKNHMKVHIIFDSFTGIEPDDKKGESCDT